MGPAFALFCAALPAFAQIADVQAKPYRGIEVSRFTIETTAGLPKDYLVMLETELMPLLGRIEGCERAARESAGAAVPDPSLRLTGVITGFAPERRAKIRAHIAFVERRSGKLLFETDLEAKEGTFGQMETGPVDATRRLARMIARLTRERFFRR